ncbi:helix-turn-helix domain-containing protein [Chitinophaga sp. GCM10012297]|uniref:AraC family transcriptional regulator n=1 Tax=Chitinophaga chungangae TaxID=2821488 RepID=A0ABS3YJZ3_9BACT|nr:AraC family transcriptional regulator [Chitinophaga chungangae]MBO9155001.1 AraC family transcriptional regulator [Chitinophaga chungangae]
MKPALEHLPREQNHSFVVKDFDYSYYPTPWHYHPEYEIVLVTESTGKRFIGDHLSDFQPGNLALIGANLPHHYRNDDKYLEEGSRLRARSIVIHFTEASLGEDFLALPESRRIRKLFARAVCGLDVGGATQRKVSRKLQEIVQLSGMRRWLCLVDILQDIAESKSLMSITRSPFVGHNPKESSRLSDVFDWIHAHFDNDIRLGEAAAIAGMQENAFSRFFSLRTRKTFSGFVQELRLQKAARLLEENELAVTEVCYECGYNNISNFNRQFLQHYGVSPLKYRRGRSD